MHWHCLSFMQCPLVANTNVHWCHVSLGHTSRRSHQFSIFPATDCASCRFSASLNEPLMGLLKDSSSQLILPKASSYSKWLDKSHCTKLISVWKDNAFRIISGYNSTLLCKLKLCQNIGFQKSNLKLNLGTTIFTVNYNQIHFHSNIPSWCNYKCSQ